MERIIVVSRTPSKRRDVCVIMLAILTDELPPQQTANRT